MVYSDVVASGLILPLKGKYTMRDVKAVQVASLFTHKTLSLEESVFIVKCSAIFHGTEYAKSLDKAVENFRTGKGML